MDLDSWVGKKVGRGICWNEPPLMVGVSSKKFERKEMEEMGVNIDELNEGGFWVLIRLDLRELIS